LIATLTKAMRDAFHLADMAWALLTAAAAALAVGSACAAVTSRQRQSFDFGWRFLLGDVNGTVPVCPASDFPTDLSGTQCFVRDCHIAVCVRAPLQTLHPRRRRSQGLSS